MLNNEAGLLEYFVNEQSRNQKPRGTLQLAGAVISPSDEDSHTFTVNAASGEQYKLRGRRESQLEGHQPPPTPAPHGRAEGTIGLSGPLQSGEELI